MKDNQQFHTVRGYELLKQEKKQLTSAMEDYLEMIFRNAGDDGYIRINTLAELLNVQASSVTKMAQRLAFLGLVDYKRYGIIQLSESGREIGQFLLKRHITIETFLRFIGITKNILVETELIEHNISLSTLEVIDRLNMFFKDNPDIIERFEDFKKA